MMNNSETIKDEKKIKVIVQTTLREGLHQVGTCGDREEEKKYVRCGEAEEVGPHS